MFLKYQIFVVGGGKLEENICENFLTSGEGETFQSQ